MKRVLSREFYALLSHDVATNRDGKIFYSQRGTGIFVPLEDLLAWFETVETTVGLAIPDWRYKSKDMAYEEVINKGHWMDLWLLHGLCPEAGTPVPAGEGVRCPKCGNLRECEACFPRIHYDPAAMTRGIEELRKEVAAGLFPIDNTYPSIEAVIDAATKAAEVRPNTDDFTKEEEARLLENVKKSTADICGMQYAARKLNFDKEQYDKFKETSMGCLVPEPPPCSICGETPKKRSLTQIIRDKLVELKPVLDANPLPQPRTLGIFINDVVHGFAGSCKPMGHDVYYLIEVISDCPLNDAIFEIHYDSKVMLKNVCHVNSRGYVFDDGTYLYEEMEVLATKADAVIQTITTTPEGRSVGTPPAMMPCSACAARGFCLLEEARGSAPCTWFDPGPKAEEPQQGLATYDMPRTKILESETLADLDEIGPAKGEK